MPPSFDPLADAYDASRPSYPSALFDLLDGLTSPPLQGAKVVEVGAGTGLATAGLVRRGARVLATDVAPQMLARLRARLPGVPVVQAAAEALPLPDGVADLVCAAQAWHWVRVPEAAAEAARVLQPEGALAAWWNDVDAAGQRWYEDQQTRLEAASPGYTRAFLRGPHADRLRATNLFATVNEATTRWTRTLDLDAYEQELRSKSYVAALGDDLEAFLAAERASLAEAFPDGRVRVPYAVRLVVARCSEDGGAGR